MTLHRSFANVDPNSADGLTLGIIRALFFISSLFVCLLTYLFDRTDTTIIPQILHCQVS